MSIHNTDTPKDFILYKERDPYYGIDPIGHPNVFNYRIIYTADAPTPERTFEYPSPVEERLDQEFKTWYRKTMGKEPR
jgi:hypothetical protein